jgi:3,4-dehydroadipyl-CoA semialdehyde dehydrogenase
VKLENLIAGRWEQGRGDGVPLHDPVTGEVVASATSDGANLGAALAYARDTGRVALHALTYAQRANLLTAIADTLTMHRDAYFDIARRNSGSPKADAAIDIDGSIYTLKTYARAGKALGETRRLAEGAPHSLSKDGSFLARHYLVPRQGVAVFINAFNFPAWGLWEKAAPALLAGMPLMLKPATPTAWLAERMVRDIVDAEVLPDGAISIVCGGARDLLDHVNETDVVSFTGSADTALRIRTHAAVVRASVPVNIEADSVNAAILGPDATPGSREFVLLVAEVVREMTQKAGQKCTAIRRVFVPAASAKSVNDAIAAELAKVKIGNPANAAVTMGPLVNRAQRLAALEGIAALLQECDRITGDPASLTLIDADPAVGAFLPPTLLYCARGASAQRVHEIEVFGPVATVIPYTSTAEAIALVRRGRGSLVASVFSSDAAFIEQLVPAIADLHGRILVVDATVDNKHTGHGNVMPSCTHGGPGRAGGGEELGGLRALAFYHRRIALQGSAARHKQFGRDAADATLLLT